MTSVSPPVFYSLLIGAGVLFGVIACWIVAVVPQRKAYELKALALQDSLDAQDDVLAERDLHVQRLQLEIDSEKRLHEERIRALRQAQQQLSQTFDSLATRALRQSNEEFLRLAQLQLGQLNESAKSELGQREKAVETLIKPVQEALAATHQQIRLMEQERKQAYGSLTQQVKGMATAQSELQLETRRLVGALRRPNVRGQWGELTLRRLVELAGMVQHCDFEEQMHVPDGDAKMRPDMVVSMPNQRKIVVDVKTPLEGYLDALETSEPTQRGLYLQAHLKNVKNRIHELASKNYWDRLPCSPEFVVLFIPGEQFLTAALDLDRNLVEYALSKNVVLATPTSLIALLKTVSYGWRQEQLDANAEVIRKLAVELHHRLGTFGEHFAKLAKALSASVKHYNHLVGSLERSVMPAARRFEELGVDSQKNLPSVETLDDSAREPTQSNAD